MHLTQVATTSSMVPRWNITRKLCSSSKRNFRRKRAVASTCFSCGGPRGSGARGYLVPRYAEASHHLVSGYVVCDQPEERSQRTGFTAGPGTGQLSHGLV